MPEKQFSGAPFGTQKSRFDVSAVHPQNKMPGTFTEAPYCRVATARETVLRGPGSYEEERGAFTERSVRHKSAGPNWRRAFACEKISEIPHMLYKDQWKQNKMVVEQLGPGRYRIKDFIDDMGTRPCSHRGVCSSMGPRLKPDNKWLASLPGPGHYGKGGIPSAAHEEKQSQSQSTKGVMEGCGRAHSALEKEKGSGLVPGCYTQPGELEEFLNKRVSKRGPYDCYTGERMVKNKRILASTHLAPGKYEIKAFTDDMKDKGAGAFSTLAQYPTPPTERIYCCTLTQWPRNKEDPGPGQYYKPRTNTTVQKNKNISFLSTRDRLIRRSKHLNPVGVGQYFIDRWDQFQSRNGNESVFNSLIPRLPKDVDSPQERMLIERVHPKHADTPGRLQPYTQAEAPC